MKADNLKASLIIGLLAHNRVDLCRFPSIQHLVYKFKYLVLFLVALRREFSQHPGSEWKPGTAIPPKPLP